MKKFIHSATSTPLAVIIAILISGARPPMAQAVTPAPDGGYPGFNTAEGGDALKNLTTGVGNAAVGWYSLFSNTDGSYNTAVGAGTLVLNVGNQSTGEGVGNTAVGSAALLLNTTGYFNTAAGFAALESNTDGFYNTADGQSALYHNTTGSNNSAMGSAALIANTSGYFNTGVGAGAAFDNTEGHDNTAVGVNALFSNTTANSSTAVGSAALGGSTGSGNTAVGFFALQSNTSGQNNTALGNAAGNNLTTGNNNIDIGYNVLGVAGESNTIRIGDTDITSTYIRGISGATIASGATVLVASDGHLGTLTSSERFKEDIKPMSDASKELFALKPVTFRYKEAIDPKDTAQFGLIAEEVEKVNPDLVVHDEKGKPYSVRYDQVNAMLLNEFLKAHRKIGEQDRRIREQQAKIAKLESDASKQQAATSRLNKEMESLITRVRAQDSKIQRVSDGIELSKATSRTAANP